MKSFTIFVFLNIIHPCFYLKHTAFWRWYSLSVRKSSQLNWTQSPDTKVTLRLTVSQSVSKSWCRAPSGPHDQIFIVLWQLRSCVCGVSSLTRGRFCLLYMLLALVSAVFLGSESLGIRDHTLLSQIWDFPFRLLLRLAGSRWKYSTQPPHGPLQTPAPTQDV
jgi:hypothetical protein